MRSISTRITAEIRNTENVIFFHIFLSLIVSSRRQSRIAAEMANEADEVLLLR